MYLRYYGLKDYPFAVAPDPGFLYLSANHREALAHLLYGAGEQGGFVALTGEVGTGKTTLIRALVDSHMPELDIALCWNPHLGATEFVATICDELGVDYTAGASLKVLVDRLNAHLLATHAANRRTVLIIDEAQNLSREVLEELRLLTNLETHKDKLLRIILVGQPELSDVLARHDLRQLAQRVTARSTLAALKREDTRAYVSHRLERAGGPQHLFSRTAIAALQWVTGGVPRLINMVCERALMGGYAHARSYIGPGTVWRAARETLPRRATSQWLRIAVPTGALAVTAVIIALAWLPDIPLTRAAEWIQLHHGDSASADPLGGHTGNGDAAGKTPGTGKASAHAVAAKTNQADPESAPVGANHRDRAPGKPAGDNHSKTVDNNQTPRQHKTPPRIAKSSGETVFTSDNGKAKKNKTKQGKSGQIPKGDADINQLLRLWGVFGSKLHISCASLRVGDLRCLSDRGSFSIVERYNRPALLVLLRGNHRQTVLLSSLGQHTATLVGANATRQVSQAKLRSLWTGRFQVIWRAESGIGLIRPGTVGDAVIWLRRRLVRVAGKNPDTKLGPPSPVYDDALESRLKHFQLTHGLEADGMAGARTQMMLNGAVPSPGSPVLKRVKK